MASELARPLLVTAELGADDFAWLNALRRQHYPVERNRVAAHLTLFRTLPPSAEMQIRHVLASFAARGKPRAVIGGMKNLGGGVAFRVLSDDLDQLRSEIAERLHGLVAGQDQTGWSPHITIQNKVPPREASALMELLGSTYDRRPIGISGLGLHRYLGGPWETLRTYPFRG